MLPGWMRRICKLADMMIRSRSARSDAGAALAEALIRLGPGFIKFGQALSTRSDLVGPEMALSLSQLQDRLPPFSSRLARAQIETELGTTLDSVFAQFNPDPVAAASIAQVHKAALKDGRKVAVKLLRPGIRRRMQADTSLFYSLARILEWLAPDLRRLKLVTAVDQFTQISSWICALKPLLPASLPTIWSMIRASIFRGLILNIQPRRCWSSNGWMASGLMMSAP
jgi:ubiquinone biosynthesis protein